MLEELLLQAIALDLKESGNITAAAESGKGGNIELNTKTIQIGDESQITAEAKNDGRWW